MPKMPTYFMPHGGGPCFFMKWEPENTWHKMANFLTQLPNDFPQKPKAILVVSAHWQERKVHIQSSPNPGMIYDYYGFPEHTYSLKFPASGAPKVAERIGELLKQANIPHTLDSERGYDHGVFIPLLLPYPKADVPVLQISLMNNMDAEKHIALGKALEPLRNEGVVIIGSGMTFHNLRYMMQQMHEIPRTENIKNKFDIWLRKSITLPSEAQRTEALINWEAAPEATFAHPEEEHLLPLHVVAGAAGEDLGKDIYKDVVLNTPQAAFKFG